MTSIFSGNPWFSKQPPVVPGHGLQHGRPRLQRPPAGMVETPVKPGSGPTYHSHAREDETFYVVSGTAEVWIDREVFRCEAGDRVFGPRNVFHTYRNVGNTDLKMILVYTPGGFEQSFLDREAMLEAGKDQSEVGRMMMERYGLTRGQLPT